jgi:hypothetical protein
MIDKDGPLTLEFKDDCKVPVGKNAEAWSRIISKIVYDYCDLHYHSWSEILDEIVKGLEKREKVYKSNCVCILCNLLQIM